MLAGVIEHENAGIRHEQLERGQALAHQRIHFELHLVVELGDDHVEAVVDDRFSLGLPLPLLPRVVECLPTVLNREVDNRRGAAKRCRRRSRLEVVGGSAAAKRHVEMRVDVDAARKQVFPRGIDHAIRLHRQHRADDRDLLALDQHVALVQVGGRDDGAALY
jgi:hypothetical protein